MKRHELEHIIRAAGAISETKELVILGSQAILAKYPNAPEELTVSQEVDTYPLDNPQLADLIDGCIGELSPFHEQFGYYAHGVGPETACLPRNWRERAIGICNESTKDIMGLCLSPVDLAASKLVAGRDKDILFVGIMLQNNYISVDELNDLFKELPQDKIEVVIQNLKKATTSIKKQSFP
jgi:hypothetical protein